MNSKALINNIYKKRVFCRLIGTAFLAAFIFFPHITVFAEEKDELRISSKGAIVIDFETGMEIYAHNADEPRPPASMTKMMTVYLVYEAIGNGQIGFDTIVPISDAVITLTNDPTQTNVPLSKNGEYTVDELLDVVIVNSACGATLALAELVGGTEQAFIQMMKDKVAQWGIDADFSSVYGGSVHTTVTPRAFAEIVRYSILDYPQILEKTSLPAAEFKGRTYKSTNLLLGEYEGIDGFKTGTHTLAGECFLGTAQRGDVRIITVTMGSGWNKRFADTAAMLDYGFDAMETARQRQLMLSRVYKTSHRLCPY